ncbi:hypothetical protein J2W97_001749 [Paenibacillus jamilae]|nr:hypothetical protein [Paenibacillus jamilae]
MISWLAIAKSLCFAAFASSHARRGSMPNRPINLSNVSLTTQYSEEPNLLLYLAIESIVNEKE